LNIPVRDLVPKSAMELPKLLLDVSMTFKIF
jgi:hypothetical protein